MTQDYSSILFIRIKTFDIELAEDLQRRLYPMFTVRELSNFFHLLLAQYDVPTIDVRATLEQHDEFEKWYVSFIKHVLPFLMGSRLPPYSDTKVKPMYQCESKKVECR